MDTAKVLALQPYFTALGERVHKVWPAAPAPLLPPHSQAITTIQIALQTVTFLVKFRSRRKYMTCTTHFHLMTHTTAHTLISNIIQRTLMLIRYPGPLHQLDIPSTS